MGTVARANDSSEKLAGLLTVFKGVEFSYKKDEKWWFEKEIAPLVKENLKAIYGMQKMGVPILDFDKIVRMNVSYGESET